MNGTCLQCPSKQIENTDDYFLYSFYDDVMATPELNEMIGKIQETAYTIILQVHKAIQM